MSIRFAYLDRLLSKDGNINSTGLTRIHIRDYENKYKGRLTCCLGHQVIARRGEKRSHHFAHKKGEGNDDCMSRSTGKWHLWWQNRLHEEFLEVYMKRNGKRHFADAYVNGTVIEFQKSKIPPDKIREREAFYGNMIWVYNFYRNDYVIKHQEKDFVGIELVGGSNYMFYGNRIMYLDIGQRYLIEVLGKKGTKVAGKYVSIDYLDMTYFKSCLINNYDRRIDRIEFRCDDLCTEKDLMNLKHEYLC